MREIDLTAAIFQSSFASEFLANDGTITIFLPENRITLLYRHHDIIDPCVFVGLHLRLATNNYQRCE
jgi:hypothetical protein